MYFFSEWLIFGLCIICDWLQVAYSFSFWLGYGERNYSFSLLPYSPLFSAASPRDQLQSRHRVTVSSCDRLAYFWKSVPTLSPLEKKSKLSWKINPSGRGGESFMRHSPCSAWAAVLLIICSACVTGSERFALRLALITCPQALQEPFCSVRKKKQTKIQHGAAWMLSSHVLCFTHFWAASAKPEILLLVSKEQKQKFRIWQLGWKDFLFSLIYFAPSLDSAGSTSSKIYVLNRTPNGVTSIMLFHVKK